MRNCFILASQYTLEKIRGQDLNKPKLYPGIPQNKVSIVLDGYHQRIFKKPKNDNKLASCNVILSHNLADFERTKRMNL